MQSKFNPHPVTPPREIDLRSWLDEIGLGEHEAVLAANGITLNDLALLTDGDLKDLGLSLGHRRRFVAAVSRTSGELAAGATGREAERRQLTVMFCDLVESMALSERLDPEDLSELISSYQDTCAGAIARFEGIIAKFMGDGILAYFGFPRAHEDDAERAVRAGLQIVSTLARQPNKAGLPLRVRIGVATGPVVVGDMIGEKAAELQAVVGETPNLAARLQAFAGPDEVIISDSTRRLVEGLFDLNDLGPQTVRGFTRPTRAFSVVAERLAESRFDASRSGNLTGFVGREQEVSLLLGLWSKAAEGAGQVVLLSGEAGIGKSRMVQKLFECLADDTYLRLRYQCSPLHVNSALHPIVRQVETACGFSITDSMEAKLDKLIAWLSGSAGGAEVLPHFGALLGLSGGGRFSEINIASRNARMRLLTTLIDHLVGQSRRSPVLLVFEDAHWIDPSSLELVKALAERISTIPALMIVSVRPPFAGLSAEAPRITAIDLERLTRAETIALIGRVASPRILPAAQMDQIVEKTDGVPLFVEELTRMLLGASAIAQPSRPDAVAHSQWSVELPSTLQDLLMARLDQLAPARRIAQIAAVIGREFSFDMLSAVSPRSPNSLRGCLDQLIESGLISVSRSQPNVRFAFKHALVRDAAYASLLKRERRQLHAAVAGAMEQAARYHIEPELLAHHCAEGGLIDTALKHWATAGRRALQRAANIEALGITSRALEVLAGLPDTPERRSRELELRLVAGGAYWVVKGFASPEAEQTFVLARELAESLGDAARLTLALRGLVACYYVRAELPRALREAEFLATLSRDINSSADLMWARMMIGCVLFHQGEFARARAELEACLAMHDPIEQSAKSVSSQIDPGVYAQATLAWNLWMLGHPDQAVEMSARALGTARAIGQPSSVAVVTSRDAIIKVLRGEIGAAREATAELRAVATEHQIAYYAVLATVLEAAILVETGDCTVSQGVLQRSLAELAAQRAGVLVPWVLSLSAITYFRSGLSEEAFGKLTEAFATIEKSGEHQWKAELFRLKGEFLLSSGADNAAVAEVCVRKAIRLAQAQGSNSLELRAALTLARMLEASDQAKPAKDQLAAIYSRFTEGHSTADLLEAKAFLDGSRSA